MFYILRLKAHSRVWLALPCLCGALHGGAEGWPDLVGNRRNCSHRERKEKRTFHEGPGEVRTSPVVGWTNRWWVRDQRKKRWMVRQEMNLR